jgi:hypothetical protein
MKGKIVRGRKFRGLVKYVLDPAKNARIIGGNLAGQDVITISRELNAVAGLRPDCERPVLHVSLRMPDGEDVSDEQWLDIVSHLFRLMDIGLNRPWLLVKHPDQHIHLVTSRVNNEGKIWKGQWEALKLIKASGDIEKLCKLTITAGLRQSKPKQVRLTSGQLKKADREWKRNKQPEIPGKIEIAERIEQAIQASNGTFNDFREQLEKLGVTIQTNKATTGHISGISYCWNGIAIKGSRVARAYSWGGIHQLLKEKTDENSGTAGEADITDPNGSGSGAAQQGIAGAGKQPDLAGDRLREVERAVAPAINGTLPINGIGAGCIGADSLENPSVRQQAPAPRRVAPANNPPIKITLS